MVWEFFQFGQVRKNREQLERVTRELAELSTLGTDLTRRVVELEQRLESVEERVEQVLPHLDRQPQSDTPGRRFENGSDPASAATSGGPLSEEGDEPDEEA